MATHKEWEIIKNGDGIIASKNGCNPMPGACTFRSIEDAIQGIECYKQAQETGENFWDIVRSRSWNQ